MKQILVACSIGITELKRSLSAVLEQAGAEPVAVLNHNRRVRYIRAADPSRQRRLLRGVGMCMLLSARARGLSVV